MSVLLPEVLETRREGDHKVTLKLRLPAELLYFKGHFPGAPILPGVVQTDWAIHFGRELLPVKGDFKALEILKFQQVLQPGQTPDLELEYKAEKGALAFCYVSAKGKHSSGTVVFG